jgi:hypothetical protein
MRRLAGVVVVLALFRVCEGIAGAQASYYYLHFSASGNCSDDPHGGGYFVASAFDCNVEDAPGKYYFDFYGQTPPTSKFIKATAASTGAHCFEEYVYTFTDGTYGPSWGAVIDCFDPSTNNLMASDFDLYFRLDTLPDSAHDAGYARVDCSTGTCATSEQWSSRSSAVSTTSSAAGVYDVKFSGLSHGANLANVQASDICTSGWDGSTCAGITCRPTGSTIAGSDAHVTVRCRNAAGTLTNGAFRVMYTTWSADQDFSCVYTGVCNLSGAQDPQFALGYANLKNSLTFYTPANNANYVYGPNGPVLDTQHPVQIHGLGGGAYDIILPDQIMDDDSNGTPEFQGSSIMVTTVDDNSGWKTCSVVSRTQSWTPNPIQIIAHVQCYGRTGNGTTAPFYVHLTNEFGP